MKNYVSHEKLADDFLVEKKSRRPSVTFSTVGITTFNIHEKHDLNKKLGKLGDS